MLQTLPMLKDFTAARFQDLTDGLHEFSIVGLNGSLQCFQLRLHGNRKRIRQAQFDLWLSDWNMRPEAAERFGEELWPSLSAVLPKEVWGYGTLPLGESTMMFLMPRAQQGVWLKRAAEYLLNPDNLYSIVPHFIGAN